MKKIIILFFATIMLWQCGSIPKPKPITYKIRGKITGLNQKEVVLSTFDKDLKSKALDTVIVKDGYFEFTVPQQNPTIAIISVKGSRVHIPLIIGDGNIDMDVNKANPFQSDLSKTTSQLTHKFFTYENNAKKDKEKGIFLMQKYRTSHNNKQRDSIKKVFENWREEAENAQYSFIENNKDVVGLIVMQSLLSSQKADFHKIRKVFKNYPSTVKSSNLGKYINNFLLTKSVTEIGGKAPDFIGTTPEGNKLSLKNALGKVTLIDFWASWCRPCRMENPYMVEIYNKYHNQGFNVISVSLDKTKESWLHAIKDDGLKWQHVSELKFWKDPIAKKYGVRSIPQTFLLDKDGIIRAKNLRREELEQKIKELLNE